jgi:hypothetical protein
MAAALLAVLLGVHCNLVTGQYTTDPATGGGGNTSTGATAGGGTGPPLVSQDVLVRYYLDDGAIGEQPQLAADSAAQPLLPLTIVYGDPGSGGHDGTQVQWTELEGSRGLRWQESHGNGDAHCPLTATKVAQALAEAHSATIELVTALEGEVDNTSLIGLGDGNGWLGLRVRDTSELEAAASVDPPTIGRWQVALLERNVLHLVIDTSQSDANERVLLYVDGVLVSSAGASPPPQNYVLAVTAGDLHLGNDGGWNSIAGTLAYAALYGRALTAAQVANNVAVLTRGDDSPH